jgi:hypothetical protein
MLGFQLRRLGAGRETAVDMHGLDADAEKRSEL